MPRSMSRVRLGINGIAHRPIDDSFINQPLILALGDVAIRFAESN
jgi:hypothetical protein